MTLMSRQPNHSVLWLFENVVHMNKETKETISRFLEVSIARVLDDKISESLLELFFCLLVLHASPDSLGLDNWGT